MRSAAVSAVILPVAAEAAEGPFFSLRNTDFIVLVSFIIFVVALIYFKAPHFAGRLIDGRIDLMRRDIEEVGRLETEASAALTEAQERQRQSEEQAERLMMTARQSAEALIEEARRAVKQAGERRLHAAREQITSAEAAERTEIRNQAVEIAMHAVTLIMTERMTERDRNAALDHALSEVANNLR